VLRVPKPKVDEEGEVGDREQREHEGIGVHVSISSREAAMRQSVR
jgi:hypothetical protein